MNPNTIFFIIVALIAILGAVGVLAFKNPIRSALCLVVNFVCLGVIYFAMNLHMLGISQILVYIGLIMMLFLFCILLLNLSTPQMLQEPSSLKRSVALLLSGAMIVVLISQVIGPLSSTTSISAPDDYGTAKSVGAALFTNWVYGFEIASVLLLVGIVGSILLAKRRG